MNPLLTCSQVTDRLTDYQEGATPFALRWRMRIHLSLCPGCKAFLRALKQLPTLVRVALSPSADPAPEAKAALKGALARLGQSKPGAQVALPPAGDT